ncbi:MAG TPA: hypothetical protein VGR96_08920 [Acidobacteriaceae bacterium]|nr:hypothetical protein [Acidobacteriaceae bacterium]
MFVRCTVCQAEIAQQAAQMICGRCAASMPRYADAAAPAEETAGSGAVERDHRGIALPRRHMVGGIITPQ